VPEKISCRTPAEDRAGVTNIPKWKYDEVSQAILSVLERGDIAFSDLRDAVMAELSSETLENLGSVSWHVTTVKLEMEVRGEIERMPGKVPQRLQLPAT